MQTKFVVAFCGLQGTDGQKPTAREAAISAGCNPSNAKTMAWRWLKLPAVREAIRERRLEIAAAASITPEFVLSQWRDIATADPNDLMQLRLVNCRHCRGFNHGYQWTEAEYVEACNLAVLRKQDPPDFTGGFGFDGRLDPVEDCPECNGLGEKVIHFTDTRKLKKGARRLYAGVQQTRDGLKIITRDQDAALSNIAKYLGMLIERKELSGPNGGPVPLAHITAEDLTDDQLAAILLADASEPSTDA